MTGLAVAALLNAPALWGPLVPGGYAVGFEVIALHDEARRLDGGPRPVQVVAWYPARTAPGSLPARYGFYSRLADQERPHASASDRPPSPPAGGPDLEPLMASTVAGVQGAPPASGTFPLVVVAQGNGQSAAHQAILAEFLASHGYVVATSPSPLRLGSRMESEADVLPVAHEQALDLQLVARELRGRPFVSGTPTAFVGHSFGARGALLAAALVPASVLVSLDGGIGSSTGKGWLSGERTFDAKALEIPLLHFYEEVDAFMAPDFELLRSMSGVERILVRVEGMAHRHFTSFGWAAAAFPGLDDPDPARGERCAAVAETTRLFLNAHVKADEESARTLAGRGDDAILRFTRLPAARARR